MSALVKIKTIKNYFEQQKRRLDPDRLAPDMFDRLSDMYERLAGNVDEIGYEITRLQKLVPIKGLAPAVRLEDSSAKPPAPPADPCPDCYDTGIVRDRPAGTGTVRFIAAGNRRYRVHCRCARGVETARIYRDRMQAQGLTVPDEAIAGLLALEQEGAD